MKETKELFELTNPQKSIWSIEQFYPNTNINSIGGTTKILEIIDTTLLTKAINITVQKNDALRTRIILKDDKPYQYFADYKEETYEIIKTTKNQFDEMIATLIPTPFKLIDSKLFTFKIYLFENGEGAFVTFLHHLICDAWTTSLYVNEIMTIYRNLKDNISIDDIAFPSYKSFITSEQKYISSDRYEIDKKYWESQFSTSYNFTSLKNNHDTFSTEFTRKTFKLPAEVLSKINKLNADFGTTTPAFLLSIFSIYFSKLLNTESFTFGTPVLNRSNFAEKNTFGAFISTAPLITNYMENNSFLENTLELLKNQKMMYRHLKYPYSEITKYVKDVTGHAEKLYDVIFSYQNARSDVNKLNIPFEIIWVPANNQLESLMIHIADMNDSGILSINYDYQISVFTDEDISTMHERIERIMYQVLSNPNILCKEIEIVSIKEKNQLLRDFNNTAAAFNRNSTIIQEFEKGVKIHPDTIALSMKNTSYTYSELDNCANQLASVLIKNGVKENDIVGILLPRSCDIIISILAILKIGATYMPIEPEYPKSRVDYMIENSKATNIITNTELETILTNDTNRINLDDIILNKFEKVELPPAQLSPYSLAYIMYTSGTTGVPKAVMIRNYSVLNFAESMKKRLNYTSSSDNKVLSVTTMCFDIFVFEVFPTLIHGLHLIIANEEEQKNPILMSKLITEEKICKLLTTPSRVQLLFLDSKYLDCLQTLQEIILGGEPFPTNFLHDLPKYTNARIFNLYGPTETTVYSTFKELTNQNTITIGKPIENTTIYILDKNKKLLPIGIHGELYIGGSGVAKGYYKNPELTNEKFIKNPYNEDEIIYNTGDLATWLPNGELLCFGRTDNQIKIRGYRIELGDIESHIEEFPNITKSVVLLKETSEKKQFLCAYYVSEKEIEQKKLHKYLVSCLPNYMIPSSYVKLDAFPLTPNHKVNKKALPEPTSFFASEEDYIAPSTSTEKIICKVAEEVLKVDKIGIEDDLFNYSADSLSIIQMQTLLIPYAMKFKTQDFYQLRTIKELSKMVDTKNSLPEIFEEPELYKFNELIEKNVMPEELTFKDQEKGYFLSGITGYLGIHLLNELLNNTSADIYCAIREKDNLNTDDRLKEQWNYYFNSQELDTKRIHILECDITQNNFNLTEKELDNLANQISVVLNCAANVKYYGNYSNHESINVHAVNNLINFCLKHKKHLYHISTMGVSGNYLVTQTAPNTVFTENDFYIGQNYDENVYIRSKFEAEKELYKAKSKGLNYNILRVGNLTARTSDGKFQRNKDDNAFYNILRFIASNGIIPKDMMFQTLEFTPVDLCAKAVILITKLNNINHKTFHIYNEHFLSLEKFVNMLDKAGVIVEQLPSDMFNEKLIQLSTDEDTRGTLKAVVNDLDSKHGLSFMPSVILSNKITNKYLKKLNFEWPEINFDYINETLKIMNLD